MKKSIERLIQIVKEDWGEIRQVIAISAITSVIANVLLVLLPMIL